jgi:hypothetical protein
MVENRFFQNSRKLRRFYIESTSSIYALKNYEKFANTTPMQRRNKVDGDPRCDSETALYLCLRPPSMLATQPIPLVNQ